MAGLSTVVTWEPQYGNSWKLTALPEPRSKQVGARSTTPVYTHRHGTSCSLVPTCLRPWLPQVSGVSNDDLAILQSLEVSELGRGGEKAFRRLAWIVLLHSAGAASGSM